MRQAVYRLPSSPARESSFGAGGLENLCELTFEAIESARWNPTAGCLVDRVAPGLPLVISFGFLNERDLPIFDFFGRTKKLEARAGVSFNRILVRDLENAWYHRGVPGLGSHVDEVASSLRGLIGSMRPSRVTTIGQSMGGYGALMFGMLLNADRIISLGSLSYLDPAEALRYGDRRYLQWMESLESGWPISGYYDLAQLGNAIDFRGELHLVFGNHPGNDDANSGNHDAVHALRLASLPNAVLHPYAASQHTVVDWLKANGQLDDLLAHLLLTPSDAVEPLAPVCLDVVSDPTPSGEEFGERGFIVHRQGTGIPLLLAFVTPQLFGGDSLQADLVSKIAGQEDRPINWVVLRDDTGAGFSRGIAGLGHSLDDAVAGVKALAAALETTEIVTFGEGIGGHAALVFGVLLGAKSIVAVEPVASLDAEWLDRYGDWRWSSQRAERARPPVPKQYDVPALMSRTGYEGRAYLLFGTRRDNDLEDVHLDTIHAQWLARSDRVTLCPFPQVRQGTLAWLEECGLARGTISGYLFDDVPIAPSLNRAPVLDRGSTQRSQRLYAHPVIETCHTTENAADPGPTYGMAIDRQPKSAVDDTWRCWLAENLALGALPDDLAAVMTRNGIAKRDASREIDLARSSPYLRGARRMQGWLQRRDGLLRTYRQLDRMSPFFGEIEHRHRLARTDFLERHYTTNRPVIISGMIDDWPALTRWAVDDLLERASHPSSDNRLDKFWSNLQPLQEYLAWGDQPVRPVEFATVGTTTPAQTVVRNTLMAQVIGSQRIKLVSFRERSFVSDTIRLPSRETYPPSMTSHDTDLDDPRIVEGILRPGELLFVPVQSVLSVEAIDASWTVSFTNFLFDNDPIVA